MGEKADEDEGTWLWLGVGLKSFWSGKSCTFSSLFLALTGALRTSTGGDGKGVRIVSRLVPMVRRDRCCEWPADAFDSSSSGTFSIR